MDENHGPRKAMNAAAKSSAYPAPVKRPVVASTARPEKTLFSCVSRTP